MTELIHTINAVQEVFSSTGLSLGINLPRIAVVGGQSAGKSSVLECFVGRDFLPRGSGIVTRRPLVLQLHHSKGEEYATFLHTGERSFAVGEEVRQEIAAETEREIGDNKGISRKPIHLRIYSPNVLDLTLIDLPGMTKVAVGDQPEDIEVQIREMILEYILEDNTIILAVTPANQDLANSDALQLAREVDKRGDRTIGVITKLDLMDKGTDALDVLQNKVLPLKKGYIGVVNRSQDDINHRRSIRTAVSAEQKFFMSSPYKDMTSRLGTKYLQQVLHKELGSHIKVKLPEIRKQLVQKEKEAEATLKDLGYEEGKSGDKGKLVYKLVNLFSDRVTGSIDGDGNINVDEVNRGAIINRKFYKAFPNIIAEALDIAASLDKEIAVAIANVHGTRNPLFVPEKAFQHIVQNILSRYEKPLESCVSLIRKDLDEVLEESLMPLERYPVMYEEVRRLVSGLLDTSEETTVTHLLNHVKAQKAFMNTRHPDFERESLPQKKPSIDRSDSLAQIAHHPFEKEEPTLLRQGAINRQQSPVSPKLSRKAPLPPQHRSGKGDQLTPLAQLPNVSPPAPKQKDVCAKAILGNQLIRDQSSSLKRLVGEYIGIVDITIQDITPKYVMFSLVNAMQEYVKKGLLGDLMQDWGTLEGQEELVRREDKSGEIKQVLAKQSAIRQAMEKISKLWRAS